MCSKKKLTKDPIKSLPVKCPACKETLKNRYSLPRHTRSCKVWDEVIPVRPSEFNFDEHYKTELWAEGLVEGVDYVECQICLQEGISFRKRRMTDHLQKTHNVTREEYETNFPSHTANCDGVYNTRKLTVQAKYGVDNVFQVPEIIAKIHENGHPAQTLEVRERRDQTNLKRYGHINPLGGMEGIKRARQGTFKKYGHYHSAHVPELQEERKKRNLEKYGVEYFVQTEEFQIASKKTFRKNWGSDHWMKSKRGFQQHKEMNLKRHGYETTFQNPATLAKAYRNNIRNHGGRHSASCPKVRQKYMKSCRRKYGFDNAAKHPKVKAKIIETWIQNYGVPFPPPSIRNKFESPNKLEQKVSAMNQQLHFVGDGQVYIHLPTVNKRKNPDFIVLPTKFPKETLTKETLKTLPITKVVEVFGDFWHGEVWTGVPDDQHEAELIAAFAAEGIECLVLWESEINKNTEGVVAKLEQFIIGN